jgi:hypothetical protein
MHGLRDFEPCVLIVYVSLGRGTGVTSECRLDGCLYCCWLLVLTYQLHGPAKQPADRHAVP